VKSVASERYSEAVIISLNVSSYSYTKKTKKFLLLGPLYEGHALGGPSLHVSSAKLLMDSDMILSNSKICNVYLIFICVGICNSYISPNQN
jgi:hypothetical protein